MAIKSANEIERIYTALAQLKDSASSPESIIASKDAFGVLIGAVDDPDVKVRILLAGEIPSYYHWHPSESAINALFDLCEDADTTVRIAALKGLHKLCEKTPQASPRITDVLLQLLNIEDPVELKTVILFISHMVS